MKVEDYSLADGTPWRLFTPGGAEPGWAVLWLQGFTSTTVGHSSGCQRMATASGVTFAMLDYAGHGQHPVSLDQATRRQQFDEVCAVYDELIDHGFNKIIVVGGSFGSYLAALLSGVRQPAALVLRASANYKDEEFELPHSQTDSANDRIATVNYRQSIDQSYSNRAIESLSTYDGPSYIFEHDHDEVVPVNMQQSYYRAARHGSYIVIHGAEHSPKLMLNAAAWFDVIEKWVQTIIYITVHDPSSRS